MKKHPIIFAMALIAAAGANGAMDTSTLTGSTRNLDGGRIYRVTDNVNISVGNGESALTASPAGEGDGKIVVIDIAEGKTLTVKGSDASGNTGAGAGIELPSGMTLYITGKGKLVATGGNAANGGNGGDGRDAYQQQEENEKFWNGRGGRGGDGGGGA
ncbi:MAG: hypothetical protein J6T51_01300, partial [Kiritimatiellae bacterium]|nr:hypothetical protein [Kiritimatiellia bacterium]